MFKKFLENRAMTFFDLTNAAKSIPRDHILMRMKDLVDWNRFEDILSDYYDPTTGRPSCPLVLFRMLILEHFACLSDREVHEQVGYNLLYRAFVGLSPDEQVPDDTTLVRFRSRLGEEGVQRLFDELSRQLDEKGLIGRNNRVLDGSDIRARVAIRSHAQLLRRGRRLIVEAMARVDERRAEELRAKYLEQRRGEVEPEEEEELTRALIREVAEVSDEQVRSRASILESMLEPSDRPVSFEDPDARWGHKNKEKIFLGYKVHEAIDPDSRIITAVDVLPGNADESLRTGELLASEVASRDAGAAAIMDAYYAKLSVVRQIEAADCRPCIAKLRTGVLVEGFDYDPEADQLICSEGKRSIGKVRIDNGYQYYFSTKDCASCKRRKSCLTLGERKGKAKPRRRVYLSDLRKAELAAGEAGLSWRKRLYKLRSYIEPKFSEQMNRHGLRRARYWGLEKVTIQALLNSIVVNMKRAARLLFKRRSPPAPAPAAA